MSRPDHAAGERVDFATRSEIDVRTIAGYRVTYGVGPYVVVRVWQPASNHQDYWQTEIVPTKTPPAGAHPPSFGSTWFSTVPGELS